MLLNFEVKSSRSNNNILFHKIKKCLYNPSTLKSLNGVLGFVYNKASEIFRQEVKPMVKFDEDENSGDTDFDDSDDVDDSGDDSW